MLSQSFVPGAQPVPLVCLGHPLSASSLMPQVILESSSCIVLCICSILYYELAQFDAIEVPVLLLAPLRPGHFLESRGPHSDDFLAGCKLLKLNAGAKLLDATDGNRHQ